MSNLPSRAANIAGGSGKQAAGLTACGEDPAEPGIQRKAGQKERTCRGFECPVPRLFQGAERLKLGGHHHGLLRHELQEPIEAQWVLEIGSELQFARDQGRVRKVRLRDRELREGLGGGNTLT